MDGCDEHFCARFVGCVVMYGHWRGGRSPVASLKIPLDAERLADGYYRCSVWEVTEADEKTPPRGGVG